MLGHVRLTGSKIIYQGVDLIIFFLNLSMIIYMDLHSEK